MRKEQGKGWGGMEGGMRRRGKNAEWFKKKIIRGIINHKNRKSQSYIGWTFTLYSFLISIICEKMRFEKGGSPTQGFPFQSAPKTHPLPLYTQPPCASQLRDPTRLSEIQNAAPCLRRRHEIITSSLHPSDPNSEPCPVKPALIVQLHC